MLVYVLSKKGKPLMPCSCRKARLLLKEGKAKVVNRMPFTIKLKFGSSGYKQQITLGVDAGSKVVGLSATTEKSELYSGELHLRKNIVDLIATRKQYRRTRRSQKTRYREPRFLNRVSTKKKGWLAPSILNKIQSHEAIVKAIHKILPISKVVVEVASFDIQKIKDDKISGAGYQQGDQLGFMNVREYVLFRDGHSCVICKGRSKDKILNVHHIESRKTGGNSPGNLATLCKSCHDGCHSGKILHSFKISKSFRDATFMGVMRWKLMGILESKYGDVSHTYGYITKNTRISNKIDKTHSADAFCISGNINAVRNSDIFLMRKVRSHDRVLHKSNLAKGGKRIRTRGERLVKGFKNFDCVSFGNDSGFITTRRAYGQFVVSDVLGKKIASISPGKLTRIYSPRNILCAIVKNC